MDNNDNGQVPATDDQELAQVLAGMNQQADQPAIDQPMSDQPADAPVADGMQFEETGATPTPAFPTPPVESPADVVPEAPQVPELPTEPAYEQPVVPAPTEAPVSDVATTTLSPELASIKKDALEQLRPLVDRLNLPAQEKFDTLLLIIRSTDDQSLLTAANEAAKQIEDETKRAAALLDVIKEIDFFSHPAQ